MRESKQCPKCQSRQIGCVQRTIDERAFHGIRNWVLPIRAEVEVYICAECGFFEEYIKSPSQVEWEHLNDFQWCDAQSDIREAQG